MQKKQNESVKKHFNKFKTSGKVDDYLNYIQEKKKQNKEVSNDTSRGNNS